MVMPFGKHKKQPVAELSTEYLCWVVSQVQIRQNHPELIRAMLKVIKERLAVWEAVVDELGL